MALGVESTAFDIGLYGLVVALGFLFAMPFAETALDGAAGGDLHHAGGAVGRRPSDWLCRTLGASPVRAVKSFDGKRQALLFSSKTWENTWKFSEKVPDFLSVLSLSALFFLSF